LKLIRPSISRLYYTSEPIKTIAKIARTCYQSIGNNDIDLVNHLLKNKHEAMIEHISASYRVICDRGISHEIVRHRLFSFAQESTRYCKYKDNLTFIIPPWINLDPCKISMISYLTNKMYSNWLYALLTCEDSYLRLLNDGQTTQQARSVLPNSLKTEIVITGNAREWKHFFKLRCSKQAHPQMQEIANMILKDIRTVIPLIFEEI